MSAPSQDPLANGDIGLETESHDGVCEMGAAPDAEKPAAKRGGRVLLLDDDVSFNQIITDFLTEAGYTVVSVHGGAEGVREVLAGDFSVILCDMVMPTLSGDLFYRAVERARPHLCNRFIFMTGHRCDAKINEFIRSIHANGLRKPFHLDDLLCTIRLVEMCGQFAETSAFASVAVARPAPLPSPVLRGEESPIPSPAAPAALAEASASAVPRVTLPVPALERTAVATDPQQVETWSFLRWARLLFLIAMVAAIPVARYYFLLQRAAASSTTLSLLQWQSEHLSKLVQDGRETRREMEEMAAVPEGLAAERSSMKWTSALWIVSGAARGGIELTGVDLRGAKDLAGLCVLRVDGFAIGKAPQTIAENFRGEIESKLRQQFEGRSTTTRFERLDVESRAAVKDPEKQTVAFSIVVSIDRVTAREVAATKTP